MYGAPPIVETEVHATLPESLRRRGRETEWTTWQPGERGSDSFLEGPGFDRDGRLHCVDISHGRVFRLSGDGAFETLADYDGEPNGLRFHRDGRIFIADYKNGIVVLDPDRGEITPVVERYRLERLKAVNDLVFSNAGDLFFTDQGLTGLHDPSGRVFRLHANRELELLLDNVPSPNGLVLNLDESQLYVAVTRGNCVWRVPLLLGGGVAKVGVFIQMSGGVGPDGLALDTDGSLAVAHPGLGCVWLFSPHGEPLYRVQSCRDRKTTNIAYGGPDLRTMFITESESGCILKAQMPTPGRALFSHL